MRALLRGALLCLGAGTLVMGQAPIALPDWTQGIENSLQLGLADGFPAKGIQFKPGANFPAWLQISKSGLLKGTPPAAQSNIPVQIVLASGSHEIGRYNYSLNVKALVNPVVIPTPPANPIVIPTATADPHSGRSTTPTPANPPPTPPIVTQTNGIAKPVFANPVEPGDMQVTVSQSVAPPADTKAVVNRQNSKQPSEDAQAVKVTNNVANLQLKNPIAYCEILSVSMLAKGQPPPVIESDALTVLPKPQITALGANQLTVTLPYLPPNPPGSSTAQLAVFVKGSQVGLLDSTQKTVQIVGISGQQTTIKFANPLTANDPVVVRYTENVTSPPACSLSAESDPVKISPPQVPKIRGELVPTQTQVWAAIPFGPPGTNGNRITVLINGQPAAQLDSSGSKVEFTSPDLSKAQALITLADPLAEGDRVRLALVVNNGDEVKSPEVTVTDPLDLGKIRYYFTAGVVMSNTQGFQLQSSGTQAGLFLGLDVDRAWRTTQPSGWQRFGINTFFDTRLTSVPTQGVAAATAGSPQTADTFLQSKKAATLEAGAYLPIMFNDFTPHKTPIAFFIAPIAKTGFSTLTDESATATNSAGTAVSTAATGRFFTNFSYGTRLGVTKVKKQANGDWDRSSSPELIGYFDVGFGRFGNFQAVRDYAPQFNASVPGGCAALAGGALPGGCLAPGTLFLSERPWRWEFEGYVKIPPVFIIGFSANVGRGTPPPFVSNGINYVFTPPRDDLRFLFGAQFDFRQILKKLPSF